MKIDLAYFTPTDTIFQMVKDAELGDLDRSVGSEVRALRKNRKLTLSELASGAGCSIGYLSEVERGSRTISIKFLSAIARSLDVPLGWFFSHHDQPKNEEGKIVRAASRKQIGTKEDGLFEELLSPDLSGRFEVFLTRIDPGARSNGTLDRQVEEEGYLLQGTLDLTIDGEPFKLEEGDSFRIDKLPFFWRNSGPIQTVVIWTTSPPVY